MKKKAVGGALVLLLCIQYAVAIGLTVAFFSAYEIITWAQTVWNTLKDFYRIGKEILGYSGPDSNPYNDYQYMKISEGMHQLSDQIAEFRSYFHERMNNLESLIIDLNERNALRERYLICRAKINAVQKEYAELIEKLPKPNERIDLVSLCHYGNTRLHGDRLESKVDDIVEELLPSAWSPDMELLDLLESKLRNISDEECGRGYSPYEYLHFFYNEVMRTEVEGYMALVFSHYFVYHYNGTNNCKYEIANDPEKSVGTAFGKFKGRIEKYAEQFGRILDFLRKDFRACDGDNLEADVTYIELEGAVQTYGVPPLWYASDAICNLAEMELEAFHNEITTSLPYPCLGELVRCEAKTSPGTICVDSPYSTRRYKWFLQADQTIQKIDQSTCSKPNLYEFYPSGSYYTCLCVCYDNDALSRTTHVVNLQPVEADFKKDMVLTGVKFIVEHGVLNLQIQQGRLIDNWRVINTSWKPINDISENIKAARLNKKLFGRSPNVTADIDFHVITEMSAMDLSTVQVGPNHVATGVKFHVVKHGLQVVILSRPFNHTIGRLKTSNHLVIDIAQPATKERLYERKYPMEKQHALLQKSTEREYIKFRESDWWTDSGQTTLPLFDALPLQAIPPRPLGGIGTFLKTAEKSTAMISLKLISVDYVYYMRESSLEAKSNFPRKPSNGVSLG